MKWGVRKARSSAPASSDYKKTAPLRKKKPHELTNKQLEAVNKRRNLETQFTKMNPNHSKFKMTKMKGAAIAAGIMGAVGTAEFAYNKYNSPAGKAAVALVKKTLKEHGKTPVKVMTSWY